MSTVPPAPVPSLNPLPWEARETRGLLPAFFDTLGLLVSRSEEAWARMRQRGDTTSPLLFGTAICWLSMALQGILFRLIPATMLPGFLERRFGSFGRFGGMGLAVRLIVAPFVIVIVLFVAGCWWTYSSYAHDRLVGQQVSAAQQTPYTPETLH